MAKLVFDGPDTIYFHVSSGLNREDYEIEDNLVEPKPGELEPGWAARLATGYFITEAEAKKRAKAEAQDEAETETPKGAGVATPATENDKTETDQTDTGKKEASALSPANAEAPALIAPEGSKSSLASTNKAQGKGKGD